MTSRVNIRTPARVLLLISILLLAGACAPRVKLDRTAALHVDPAEHQPLAVVPLADSRGYPRSGALVSTAVEETLREKNYLLLKPAEMKRALAEISSASAPPSLDTVSLRKLGELSHAGLILTGAILSFRREKSYLGSGTVPVRDPQSTVSGTWVLPTYRRGGCEIRLLLRLFDPEHEAFVWMAEGHASGPADEEAYLARALAATLLEALPSLPAPPVMK